MAVVSDAQASTLVVSVAPTPVEHAIPQVDVVERGVVGDAITHGTQQVAVGVSSAAHQAAAVFVEVRTYVHENHWTLKVTALLSAIALAFFSVLTVLNIGRGFNTPLQYLLALYNLIFAAMIVVIDGKETWFVKLGVKGGLQAYLFQNFAFLAAPVGRGCFYLYVGLTTLLLAPHGVVWYVLYTVVGGSLCFAGVMNVSIGLKHRFQTPTGPSSQDGAPVKPGRHHRRRRDVDTEIVADTV